MGLREETAEAITRLGLVAVVRTKRAEQVMPLCEALVQGGIECFEITFTVPDALAQIEAVARRFGNRAVLGAGSVLQPDQCRAAVKAGARFVVSPIFKPVLVELAHELGSVAIPGSYSPTEAQAAHESGAEFVKIFPADQLGPVYLKNLLAPMPHLRLIPTGGVDLETAPRFLKAGAAALGVGSALISAEVLKHERWDDLSVLAEKYVAVVRQARAPQTQSRVATR